MTGTRTTNLSPAKQTWLLLAGFGVALLLRVVIGGLGVAQSVLAGLAFAASLAAMAAADEAGAQRRVTALKLPL
jgi:hypothetical protein